MWLGGRRRCDAYLGTRAVLVSVDDAMPQVESVTGVQAGLERLRYLLGQESKALSIRVWLSGGLCRPFVVAPLDGLASRAEWFAAAEALSSERTGLGRDCAIWTDLARLSDAACAVAVEKDVLQAVREVARAARRSKLTSLAPWWSHVSAASAFRSPNLRLVAIEDCDSVTVIRGSGQTIEAADALEKSDAEGAGSQILARALLGSGLNAEECFTAVLRPGRATNSGHAMTGLVFGQLTECST